MTKEEHQKLVLKSFGKLFFLLRKINQGVGSFGMKMMKPAKWFFYDGFFQRILYFGIRVLGLSVINLLE
jgi:hypothetical protein